MRAVESMEYYQGLEHGNHIQYCTNGTTVHVTCTYRHDKKHGIERLYNDEIDWTEFSNGKRHGKHIEWHINGCLSTINQYKNGEGYGTERKYYDNGQKSHEYVNGNIEKRWTKQGEPIPKYDAMAFYNPENK